LHGVSLLYCVALVSAAEVYIVFLPLAVMHGVHPEETRFIASIHVLADTESQTNAKSAGNNFFLKKFYLAFAKIGQDS